MQPTSSESRAPADVSGGTVRPFAPGWQVDPFGVHELRYISADGTPSNVVKDVGTTTYDDPPTGTTLKEGTAELPKVATTTPIYASPIVGSTPSVPQTQLTPTSTTKRRQVWPRVAACIALLGAVVGIAVSQSGSSPRNTSTGRPAEVALSPSANIGATTTASTTVPVNSTTTAPSSSPPSSVTNRGSLSPRQSLGSAGVSPTTVPLSVSVPASGTVTPPPNTLPQAPTTTMPTPQNVTYYLQTEAACSRGPGTCSTADTAGISWVSSFGTTQVATGEPAGWTLTVTLDPGSYFGMAANLEDGDPATLYLVECTVKVNGSVVSTNLSRGPFASVSCNGTVPSP
jgi:hypothetical protein